MEEETGLGLAKTPNKNTNSKILRVKLRRFESKS
jgi:hypothetical protein